MPLLNWNREPRQAQAPRPAYHPAAGGRVSVEVLPFDPELAPGLATEPPARSGIFEACANSRCRSTRVKLWLGLRGAVFEGRWCCSPGCMRAQLELAFGREMHLRSAAAEVHPHRIPLGLTMLEHGWITAAQLRAALDAQKATGAGRLGQWLVRQRAASEELVTRALGLQWSSPVMSAVHYDGEAIAALVPRLFVDAFGVLPLRVAAGKLLYLGFENRPDPVLAHAVERMSGLRVETGVVQDSVFRPAHEDMLAAQYPRAGLIETSSSLTLLDALLKAMEQARPVDACLARVHDCLWLRIWLRPQKGAVPQCGTVEDLICSVGAH